MAAPVRRAAAPTPSGVNFGDLGIYVAGGALPEGDYCIKDLYVQMYQAQTQAGVSRGPARLGVMITFCELADPATERKQFYSMGSNADKSFAANPTGKGLVPVPGGAGTTLNESTNWAIFLKSLYDSGLPQGIFMDDLSVLDGTWVHISNVPEPEERKGYRQSQTGEAAADQTQGPKTIAVVTEIKDDGKPWEGTGGVPEVQQGKVNGQRVGTVATQRTQTASVPSKAATVTTASPSDDDLESVALGAITGVLEKNPAGVGKLILRTSTFKALSSKPEQAQQVISTYFATDDALNGILGMLGYSLQAGQVKPTA